MKFLLMMACLVFGATMIAACGGDDDGGGGEDAGNGEAEPATLTVGSVPIAPIAPLVLGEENGFFAEENLEIELETGAQGGAANLTQVVGGEFEVGFSDVVSTIIALDQGLPIVGVAPGNAGGGDPETTYTGVGVLPDGPIAEVEDLEGKTVGTNALNNISDVTIKGALEQQGVDSSTLEFIEIPIPQLPAALQEGRIDAAVLLEPFMSAALAEGAEIVLYNYAETVPTGAITSYFVHEEFAADNPDVVERFTRAINRSVEYAAENPDEVRAVIPEFTEIPPEAAEQMILPVFDPADLGPEAVETLGQFALDQDLIDAEPSADQVLGEQP